MADNGDEASLDAIPYDVRNDRRFGADIGSFNIRTPAVVQGINANKYCTTISRAGGYSFALSRELLSSPCLKAWVSRRS
jgi:hypothetical protein